jgi:anti-sigma factor RsiW
MTDRDAIDPRHHPEVASLPWYLNGTLRDEERRQIEEHLAGCAACRAELEELSQLRLRLREAYITQSGPSPQTAASVMGQVRRETAAGKKSATPGRPWLDGLENWFRSLLVPRWAPALAATLLLAQFGVLLWTVARQPAPDQVTTRSVGAPTVRLRVVFQEHATEPQIRSAIQSIRGRLIDGPANDGAYIMEAPAGDQTSVQKRIETLKGQTSVIRTVEVATP